MLDIASTIATRFGGKAINFLSFVIVLRELPLSDSALYGYIFSITLIFSTLLDVGLRNSLAVAIGNSPHHLSKHTQYGFIFWLGVSVLSIPLCYLGLLYSGLDANTGTLLPPTVVLLSALLYIRIMQGPILGSGLIGVFNKSEMASRTFLFAGTVGLLIVPGAFTLISAVWVLAISQMAAACYLFLLQKKTIFSERQKLDELLPLIRRGSIFMLAVVLMTASKRISFFAVGHISNDTSAGLFFGLQRFTEIITEIGMAVAVVAFSYAVRASNNDSAIQSVVTPTRISTAFFVALAVAMGSTSEWLVPLVLGESFGTDNTLFILLLLATLIGSVWTMIFPSLSVASSPKTVFWLLVPGVSLNVVLIPTLMPTQGLYGAAVAMLISNIVILTTFLVYCKKSFGIPYLDFLLVSKKDIKEISESIKNLPSRRKKRN